MILAWLSGMPFFMYPHFRANLFDVSPPSTPMEKKVSDHTNSFSGTSLQLTFTLELNAIKCTTAIAMVLYPSSIYSCSISHILENEFFCLGCLGSYGWKKNWVFLSNFWGWFFQLFVVKKNKNKIISSIPFWGWFFQLFVDKKKVSKIL